MNKEDLASLAPDTKKWLAVLRETYLNLETFDADTLQASLKDLAKASGIKAGLLIHPARLACTGSKIGPSLYHLMEVLGRGRVLRRFDQMISDLQQE